MLPQCKIQCEARLISGLLHFRLAHDADTFQDLDLIERTDINSRFACIDRRLLNCGKGLTDFSFLSAKDDFD